MRMRGTVAGLLLVVALAGCGAKAEKSDQPPKADVAATEAAESGDVAADAAQAALPPKAAPAAPGAAESGDGAAAPRQPALGVAGAPPSAPASRSAAPPPAVKAPTQTFAVGVSQFTFTRAGRTLRTLVFYPATG